MQKSFDLPYLFLKITFKILKFEIVKFFNTSIFFIQLLKTTKFSL